VTYAINNPNNSNLKHSLSTNITYLIDHHNNSSIQKMPNEDNVNTSTLEKSLNQYNTEAVREEKKKSVKLILSSKKRIKQITNNTQTER
jgi:hypothetical protein